MSRFSGLELRAVSLNTLFQFIVRMLGSTSTLLTTLLIASFLGLESVGSFTKVIAFVSLFFVFIDFGFNSTMLRNYYKDFDRNFGNLVVLRLLVTIALLPILITLSLILPHSELLGTGFSQIEKVAVIVFSLSLIGTSLNTTLQAYLQRRLSYSLSLLPSFAGSVCLIIVVLYALVMGNFLLLFAGYIASTAVGSFLTYLSIRNSHNPNLRLYSFSHFAKDLFISSWPLGLMLGFNFMYSRADIFILSYMKPTADVGVYGVSYRFFEIALALPTFLANSTYPLLLKHVEDKKAYFALLLKYFKLYFILSLVALIGIIAGAPLLPLLGKSFILSVAPLQLLALSLPFFFLTSIIQWHFLIRGKVKMLIPLYAGVLILNVIFNILLIPRFSYNASALITGVSEALVFAVMLWYVRKIN